MLLARATGRADCYLRATKTKAPRCDKWNLESIKTPAGFWNNINALAKNKGARVIKKQDNIEDFVIYFGTKGS